MKFIGKIWNILLVLLLASWTLAMVYFIMKDVLMPASQIITAFTFAVFTCLTFTRVFTALMSVAGIAFYAFGWWAHLTGFCGQMYVSAICIFGVLTWFTAIYWVGIPSSWRWAIKPVQN